MTPLVLLDILVALTLQVTLTVILAGIISRLAWRARWANRLWSACFVCVLLLTAAAFLMPHFRLGGFWHGLTDEAARTVAFWQYRSGYYVFTLWLVGMGTLVLVHLGRSMHLARLLRRECRPLDLQEAVEELGLDVEQIPGGLRLLTSSTLGGPFCLQLHRPVIVLPDFLQTEPISVRRNVLRHELAHLSTQHPLQLFLQRLCTFLFWYHPLVWWAGHKAALGREFLCDEMAAGHSAEQLSGYLRTLLSLVERHAKLSHSVLGFRRHRGTLALRTAYLVRCCEQRPTPRSDRHVLAAITCVFGVCALIISQFWVSFNVLASQEAGWSPWPTWSAEVLHDFGIHARDFEEFKRSRELYRIFPTHHTQSS